jgi:hypothetical protein
MTIVRHFIDREEELRLFEQMLPASHGASCLVILEEPGRGKTSLLWQMMEDCQRKHRVAVALLDFDTVRGGVADYRSVGRRLCDDLGQANFPNFRHLDEKMHVRSPMVTIGGGESGEAHVGGSVSTAGGSFTGRDQIQTGDIVIIESATGGAHYESWVSDALGTAIRDDLVALAARLDRVVILLDTFERVPEETRKWLLRWLFEQLPKLPHLLLVVAGRREPACVEFFERAGLWGSLIASLDSLSPFSNDDILHYFRECRQMPVEWEQIKFFSAAFRKDPQLMANVAMALTQHGASL